MSKGNYLLSISVSGQVHYVRWNLCKHDFLLNEQGALWGVKTIIRLIPGIMQNKRLCLRTVVHPPTHGVQTAARVRRSCKNISHDFWVFFLPLFICICNFVRTVKLTNSSLQMMNNNMNLLTLTRLNVIQVLSWCLIKSNDFIKSCFFPILCPRNKVVSQITHLRSFAVFVRRIKQNDVPKCSIWDTDEVTFQWTHYV